MPLPGALPSIMVARTPSPVWLLGMWMIFSTFSSRILMFRMNEGQPFTLGVNYWPRRKAMYWWGQFEAGEVRDEFALIASLGLQVVRLFLLWGDFQPAPDVVDKTCLENLGKVCDIAAENSLK